MSVYSDDLTSMGFGYNGAPFIEVDAVDGITSPGYMGIGYDGAPVTFVPSSVLAPPPMAFPSNARIFNRGIVVGAQGFKLPHYP